MKKPVFSLSAVLLAALLAGGCSSSGESADTLADGLMAHYQLDGNATDASPAKRDGVVHGASGTADRFNRANGAMAFDGANDYITVDQEHYAAANNLSVSLWANTNDFAGTNYFVMCSDFGVFSNEGAIGLAISLPDTNSARGSVVAGGWNHFVGTYDGTTIRAYVNGQLVDARHHPGSISDPNRRLTFGAFGGFWKGSLDEVRIYNRVLTLAEVRVLFQE